LMRMFLAEAEINAEVLRDQLTELRDACQSQDVDAERLLMILRMTTAKRLFGANAAAIAELAEPETIRFVVEFYARLEQLDARAEGLASRLRTLSSLDVKENGEFHETLEAGCIDGLVDYFDQARSGLESARRLCVSLGARGDSPNLDGLVATGLPISRKDTRILTAQRQRRTLG
jgi:hypothetical protein